MSSKGDGSEADGTEVCDEEEEEELIYSGKDPEVNPLQQFLDIDNGKRQHPSKKGETAADKRKNNPKMTRNVEVSMNAL